MSAFVGGARSFTKAGEIAGISDPSASAHRIFSRPRVQSALNSALASTGATPDKIASVFFQELDSEDWRARLRSAEDCARIMGEFGDRDRDSEGARSSVTNFTVVVVQPPPSMIETIDAD